MGGKTKHAPRTKNNAKPSSSATAAALLGTTTPTFVGFSALGERGGMVPYAPGFAVTEQVAENFDPNISPQLQITLRKLSKKDPMTKKKALQELIEFIKETDIETIKNLLPIWPKYYCNLANDPEHNVRELAQTVLQLLVTQCKRAIAPYLRQLVPVWLASHFDNYAPAASIARNCFQETFAGTATRTQELCTFCQTEILEFNTRNLTFHTATTLSIGKSLTPEEVEQKYQRAVISSLKSLCFFVRNTATVTTDQSQLQSDLKLLLGHQKFWSFSKHKLVTIKSAWFEFLYEILQSRVLSNVILEQKTQLITTCFQNIDDADPLVAPHVWGCCLLIQANYEDWYTPINMKKALLPKLYSLLRNGFNRNAKAICPNILPFFSNISERSLPDQGNLLEFYKKFFDELKLSITINHQLEPPLSKSDSSIINKTYFECLRYLMQILNLSDKSNQIDNFAHNLIEENLLQPISGLLKSDNINVKPFFQHTSALVAFWDRHVTIESDDSSSSISVYTDVLKLFWSRIFGLITQELGKEEDTGEMFLENVLLLVQHLELASPSLEDHKVTFEEEQFDRTNNKLESIKHNDENLLETSDDQNRTVTFVQKELKQLIIQLVRIFLAKIERRKKDDGGSRKFISKLRLLTQMFADIEFYEQFTEKGNLQSTLNTFVQLVDGVMDKDTCVYVVDIIFEILQFLNKSERFDFIESNLLKLPQPYIQSHVLQFLLSYPLCIEPKVIEMLATKEICENIARIAKEVLHDDDKEKFNLLHKCFFQTDSGNILINPSTVDAILLSVSKPLIDAELNDMVDTCGSFIAQIMPVVCSNNNSSRAVQNQIFLRLFEFSLTHTPNDYISEDTLWELTTCWQDALSSQDITVDDEMLQQCAQIVETQALDAQLTLEALDSMSEAMAKFITCSTEHIKEESERLNSIDKILLVLLVSKVTKSNVVQDFLEYCLYLEGLKTDVTISVDFARMQISAIEVFPILRRTALNFSTLLKLVCKVRSSNKQQQKEQLTDADADEITEDYCDPNENVLKQWSEVLLKELLQGIYIASAGDSLVMTTASNDQSKEFIDIALYLSEKVTFFMGDGSKIVEQIKERLMEAVLSERGDMTACRSLLYLVHHEQYAPFEENAAILLHEDLSEQFVTGAKAYKAYVNVLQYLLPKLGHKSISLSSAIMRSEPTEIWVKAAIFRALIMNNFNVDDVNETSDRNIIDSALQFITGLTEQQITQKDLFLYNCEIHKQNYSSVINSITYINLLGECVERFPYQLSIKHWDAIRIGLSSWVLSISKSIEQYRNPKVAVFIVSVYKLYAKLLTFLRDEKLKSSTELLKNVLDEWESLFAREVNVVLFKTFYALSNNVEISKEYLPCYTALLEEITPALQLIDYGFIYAFCKTSSQITLDNICNYLLRNLSSTINCLRWNAVFAIRQLTQHFVVDDIAIFDKKSESYEEPPQTSQQSIKWHFLNRYEDYINRYDMLITKYLDEFSFKISELTDLQPIDSHEALSYLLLWDCIIYACAHSPVTLRAVYTNWLKENKYEEKFLHFLFRAMPVDILKNHSAKTLSSDCFKELSWIQLTDPKLTLERYACHLYTEVLRKLPAVVRKWWNTSPSRQKNFVDNLTTNYVSSLISNEELKAIANRKEKHENMQVTVHNSTREVLAVYSIDEARMELVITLAQNYPLGAVKVECGKQIGGRASSRNVGMQLTIFLTHQNGTIFDGLTLWKNNLDKKFEGVEECYVCYTVIHQDTCQLPKLTCKTCRKKFHGPCLYKWFTTSNKSTCPICRNVF